MSHIHEKIDFTVEVFIVHKNKVLLRKHDKYGYWLSIGGHIELDEDPIMACVREVKEEVGLDIEICGSIPPFKDNDFISIIAPKYMGKNKVSEKHEHITLVYFAKATTDVISSAINDHEKSLARWATKEELGTMDLRTNVLFYAENALKELGW
ncbi:MAG: NUDIX domain-containing protein [Patescibacteria group bacterium]